MGTVTASLERSLKNCSLNNHTSSPVGLGRSSSSDSSDIINFNASSSHHNSTLIDLNSHLSLPFHWEQCLDLKTGELYYINWSTGMKAKEDPRALTTGYSGDYYSEEDEDEEEEEEESNPYDSEGSTTESSSCSSTRDSFRSAKRGIQRQQRQQQQQQQQQLRQDAVLVVAGCKSCLMYYMVPKHVDECPKCSGHLLHFAANNSSP